VCFLRLLIGWCFCPLLGLQFSLHYRIY
jgi:hypothetical protein